jgi:L-ribulose-5-phosphate 4-epimerase
MLEDLKEEVCKANIELHRLGLAPLTWGNVSGINKEEGLVVIKPSGVLYHELKPEHMVVIDLSGKKVDGDKNPSTDTPSHLAIYNAWKNIGGVVHTHSTYASMFAQAGVALKCFGTTHADYFYGEVPLTRPLTPQEVKEDYEGNTGKTVIECFSDRKPEETPAALAIHHGPFSWGPDPQKALENSFVLEQAAKMAIGTLSLRPDAPGLPKHMLEKHYLRKHGPGAYYGQDKK